MKTVKAFVVIIGLFFVSCGEDTDPLPTPADDCQPAMFDSQTLEILPLGDSRVEGNTPLYESYRFELWKLLVDAQWNFDFIGTRTDDGDYPDFQNTCFDADHQGTGGATTTDILNTLNQVTFDKIPEVVLLGIGGNDLLGFNLTVGQIVSNVEEIMGQLRGLNPNIIILVEQIAPGQSIIMTPENTQTFDDFNLQISDLANQLTTEQAPIIVVDMATGWNDAFLADPVHYNQAGAARVAERYFDALDNAIDP